ncbi:TonB-dependent receptor [Sphingobium sp. CR2-8]|uniref:TonB-dependent receptor n=1 Tax=Sphingobium sp. CR2-8 TaxID=1306534 RepID=UPI002DBBD7D6|nr:TonB-dependent receptor [Sphingobium sp. CR2-8]MEC3909273.1 TonB-dependent receptor [Sphingobium sp. CR2-8]
MQGNGFNRGNRHWLAGASLAALLLAMPGGALAQDTAQADPAQAAAAPQVAADGDAADIVVTGFRQSLGAAINLKRQTVGSVDAIVAEDIAKFPDQNLAESLQRIPGISIQRDGGEGRAITVRGLGAQFTRVRVNGLETVATSTDGASSNRDRAFDFNVFASELFSSLVVHKTAEASLDEGSLGAVVDLNTGNPLAGKGGFTFVGSATGSYNDLSKKWGPRLAGLMSWKSDDGQWGVALSAAYSKLDTKQMGNNTVRWSQARLDSVNGTRCFTQPNSGGTYLPGAACNQAALAFHPRIPRYGEIAQERERLGITGSIQWAPSEATKVSIDGLFSRFRETREEKWGEVLLRSNERSIDVLNPVYDSNNNMVSATLNDAWVRTEHYLRKSQTKFYQLGATWDQDLGDSFRFTLLGGFSKSDASIPVETTLVFDDRDAQGYKYDYSDMRRPVLTFGTSVTDPANFQLAEIRDRPSSTINKFRTVQLRTEWDVAEGFTVKTGGVYRRFSFDTEGFTRDTVVCGNGGLDRVLGTVNCSPTSAFGPTAIYGLPVTAALSQLFTLKGANAPAGTTTQWLVPNLETGTAYTKLYDRALAVDPGNTRGVVETVKGGYIQFDAKGDIFGLEYAANAGVRYVRTGQSAQGLLAGVNRTIRRSYEDWLPALNVAIFPHRDFIVRASVADVITRPSLGSLTPGGSVDGFNYNISFGNPQLEPFRATSYDLAFEYYFAPQSLFSVAFFKKDVSSFPISDTTTGTYASTGLPVSIIPPSSPAAGNVEGRLWNITRPINGSGASLKGVEIALQAPFTFLPGFLSHFGGIVNATFIKSSATYTTPGPILNPCSGANCALGPNVPVTRTETLFGLSKKAINGTLYYEDAKFSARASVSYRGPYIDGTSGTGNVFEGYNSTINVDASIRYKLFEGLELSLEGINLTDDYRDRYTDVDTNRNYEQLHFGRTIQIGARFKM